MRKTKTLLISLSQVSKNRRLWRELYALIQFGLQSSIWGDHPIPFDAHVVGHEGFSVHGRKNSDEIEIKFYGRMSGPKTDSEMATMRREMREAVQAVAQRHGYADVYYRQRKPTQFT